MRERRRTVDLWASLLPAIFALLVSAASAEEIDVPIPAPRPIEEGEAPIPQPRPEEPRRTYTDAKRDEPDRDTEPGSCRARLIELGVSFEDRPGIADENGCRIDRPLAVTALGKDIAISPEAVLNCAAAEAIARFAQGQVLPLAISRFGQGLEAIRHDSDYVCRPRADTGRLSEHAYGNALDVAAFVLEDGRVLDVRVRPELDEPKAAEFQKAVREAACGPFKTVLGPGTNADHATHFHIDLAPRRNGSTYCR